MAYLTLFHLDLTNFISFDQYLVIVSKTHCWIVKWWLWLHTYSSTSKLSNRESFFTIPWNEWWKVLSQLERSTKHFVLNSLRCKLLEGEPKFDQDLQNDKYLTLLSRAGFSVPPKELVEFMYSCFEILDFVEGDIQSTGQDTRSAMYVLKYCGPSSNSAANTI